MEGVLVVAIALLFFLLINGLVFQGLALRRTRIAKDVLKTHLDIMGIDLSFEKLRNERYIKMLKTERYLSNSWRERYFNTESKQLGFTDKELKELIILCHPDKHNGSDKATRATAKLNAMRTK